MLRVSTQYVSTMRPGLANPHLEREEAMRDSDLSGNSAQRGTSHKSRRARIQRMDLDSQNPRRKRQLALRFESLFADLDSACPQRRDH
jgi:hypothetical protein